MTNKELQEILKKFPDDAEIWKEFEGLWPYDDDLQIVEVSTLGIPDGDNWESILRESAVEHKDAGEIASKVKTIIL